MENGIREVNNCNSFLICEIICLLLKKKKKKKQFQIISFMKQPVQDLNTSLTLKSTLYQLIMYLSILFSNNEKFQNASHPENFLNAFF